MPDFDTIFVSGGDNEVHTKTYVRRQSDGFTVPHDSPLAPSIIGAQVDNASLQALGDALVKAGTIDQATLDVALTPVATLLSPDGAIAPGSPHTGLVGEAIAQPVAAPSAPKSVS